jgi:cysteine desulfurase
MRTRAYFDWAATSPPDEDIIAQSAEVAREFFGNPSSAHACGKRAREKLEQAREICARVLGVKPSALFFTSGGTEANHIPLLNTLSKPRGTILISELEHPSVSAMARSIKRLGWNVAPIKSEDGIITPAAVKKALTDDTRLVCALAVHNETGAAQDTALIADEIAAFFDGKRRAKLHVDAVQAAGKIPFGITPGIDSAAFCAHKLSGPRGIGLLYLAEPNPDSFARGGGQESGVRSGTENLFGAWAMAQCLERYYIDFSAVRAEDPPRAYTRYLEQIALTGDFIDGLLSIEGCALVPAARQSGDARFSPWIVRAAFDGVPGGVMQRALDAEGFAVSTGSACSTRDPQSALAPVRFSFGHASAKADMDALLDAVKTIAAKLSKGR